MNTRNFFSALSFLLFTLGTQAQQTNILYVRPNTSKGDGKTWDKAINDLQTALNRSRKGTQIWVAEGIYFPTNSTDRTVSFEIPDGVAVYGGFAGTETTLQQRNVVQHPTILSGNIGNEDAEDNSYNVIHTKNVSAGTLLDGLMITGGNANGEGQTAGRQRSGGAWYNEGIQGQSNPTITNCIFIDNFAKDGGAIYNNGKGGEASPTIKDCQFVTNATDFDGGALYNDGRANGKSNPTLVGCRFEGNKGNYGGAVFNYGMNGAAAPTFTNCVFSTNNAYVKGGAVFHICDTELDKVAMFGNSVFNNNSALDHNSDEVHQYLIGTRQMAAN